ncbi:hypothetical protein ES703_115979 [subsurface metagenome]
MTGKERIKKAFANNGEPDRVPIESGLDFDTLTDLSGLDYWKYQEQGHTELSSLITWCNRLGFDLYYFAAGIIRIVSIPQPLMGKVIILSPFTLREPIFSSTIFVW